MQSNRRQNAQDVLNGEFEHMQRRCFSMISITLAEARSRIGHLLDEETMLFDILSDETTLFEESCALPKTRWKPNPSAFSKQCPSDSFSPKAMLELIDKPRKPIVESNALVNGALPSAPNAIAASNIDGANKVFQQANGHGQVASSKTSIVNLETHVERSERASSRSGHHGKPRGKHSQRLQEALRRDSGPDIIRNLSIAQMIHMSISMEGGCRASIRRLLHSTKWDLFIATVIITNAVFMGYQIDWSTKHVNTPTPNDQYVIGYIFNVIFAVELLFRIIDERCHFWSIRNKMAHWNYLDTFIVASSLVEVYFESRLFFSDDGADSDNTLDAGRLKIVRIIRTSRLLKTFRIARLVHFFRSLRTLVFSILCTLKSVFWALLLMLLIIYLFAMFFTQAVGGYKENSGDLACTEAEQLCEFWGDLSLSMLSLFEAIAGGISWHEILVPLQKNLDIIWIFVFLFYVAFLYFAVLNVITGVFCESAIQSAKNDQEMVIQEAIMAKNAYIEKLTRLFKDIDQDGSNEITLSELEQFMNDEMAGAFFEYLELEVDDAGAVIKLIDADGSGELSLEEFIDGVCRLRGPAKALDVANVLYDQKAFQRYVSQALDNLSALLGCKGHHMHSGFQDKCGLSESDV